MAASKPTFPLSGAKDPLALIRHFGTLTLVWVVPLSGHRLTPRPSLQPSTTVTSSEFYRMPRNFFP